MEASPSSQGGDERRRLGAAALWIGWRKHKSSDGGDEEEEPVDK
jgi:hypothetical protein